MKEKRAFNTTLSYFRLPPLSFILAFPSVMTDERNERARAMIFARVAFLCSNNANQSLRLARIADWNYKPSINLQLREQRLWNFRAARCHKNRVVRSVRAPTQCAVETFYGRVVDSKLTYARLSFTRQIAYSLNCINLSGDLR